MTHTTVFLIYCSCQLITSLITERSFRIKRARVRNHQTPQIIQSASSSTVWLMHEVKRSENEFWLSLLEQHMFI